MLFAYLQHVCQHPQPGQLRHSVLHCLQAHTPVAQLVGGQDGSASRVPVYQAQHRKVGEAGVDLQQTAHKPAARHAPDTMPSALDQAVMLLGHPLTAGV